MATEFQTLDFDRIPKMVGDVARTRYEEASALMEYTNWPLFLTGPSGSGKTLMAMNLAKGYGIKNNVPAYYVQLSPDMSKTSLILGLRLTERNGATVLEPVDGIVAQAMREGAVLVVDEATQTVQELLLMFNSILDRTSVTSIGDRIVYAEKSFRVLFTANHSQYAGNVRLPQSFAQRLVALWFDYPEWTDECKVAARIAREEYSGEYNVPESVARYIVSFIREIRKEQFPLSARNAAIALIRCNIAAEMYGGKDNKNVDDYFTSGQNVESVRRKIASRVFPPGTDIRGTDDLRDPNLVSFVRYVSAIGVERFKEIMLSAMMYHLDVDGTELTRDTVKNAISSSVI